jgi:hypothetical protein
MKEKFLLFVISVSLLLSGCGGTSPKDASLAPLQGGEGVSEAVIAPISIYATLQGMRAAAAGNAGTFLMESDKVIVFAWSKGNAWNFAAIARDGRPVLDMVKEFVNGQKIDTYSFSGFIKSLESVGFKQITPDLLPAEVTGTLLGYTTELLSLGVRALPSVMVIPVVPSMLEVPGRVEVQG